jgi:hypothetical protein
MIKDPSDDNISHKTKNSSLSDSTLPPIKVAPKISNPRETDLKKNRRTRGNELGYSQQVRIISLCGMGNELDNQL